MGFISWSANQLKTSIAKLSEVHGLKCPKCDSTDINSVKPGLMEGASRASFALLSPITLLFTKSKKPLRVCRKCGFSWEDR